MTVAVIMTGCDQGPATTDNGITAEPQVATSKDFGDYIVYFNAITTDELQPDVARTYNIARSSNRALLNISVVKKVEGSIGAPVTAAVEVTANNLTGQLKNLSVRQIQEGDAIYYIGDVPVANAENLVFNLSVTPTGTTETYEVRFKRQFFND
jgi:hypothetical protein